MPAAARSSPPAFVSDLTGIPVHYTLSTNFAGFARMVDLIGGIDLDIEQP